jgi:hypothetical protein
MIRADALEVPELEVSKVFSVNHDTFNEIPVIGLNQKNLI